MKIDRASFQHRAAELLTQYGYVLVTGVCVAVIIFTAVWTERNQPTDEHKEKATYPAAQMMQQSLADAAKPTPTAIPKAWYWPLDVLTVLTAYDSHALIRYTNGIWQTHQAIDLAADDNSAVYAMHDGIITHVVQCGDHAVAVTIDHQNGVTALYAPMNTDIPVTLGDVVVAGQQIGTVGRDGMPDAVDIPHLHVYTEYRTRAIDPRLLWMEEQQGDAR